MTTRFKAACIQNSATADPLADLKVLLRLTAEAAAQGARFIAYPEYCAGIDTVGGALTPFAVAEREHPVIPAVAEAARRHNAHILIGSIGVRAPDGRVYNRSLMISPAGEIAARYDKLHLFDVDLGPGKSYRESATIAPGGEAVLAPLPAGQAGLSICYDLRFAVLYRALAQAGAQVLAIPAAFTRITGEAHWHVLCRARAIETGSFVVAPCQHGTLPGGSACYGHSLIIDPWGRVLADGGEAEGVVVAEIDLAESAAARRRIPALTHDRPIALARNLKAAE